MVKSNWYNNFQRKITEPTAGSTETNQISPCFVKRLIVRVSELPFIPCGETEEKNLLKSACDGRIIYNFLIFYWLTSQSYQLSLRARFAFSQVPSGSVFLAWFDCKKNWQQSFYCLFYLKPNGKIETITAQKRNFLLLIYFTNFSEDIKGMKDYNI